MRELIGVASWFPHMKSRSLYGNICINRAALQTIINVTCLITDTRCCPEMNTLLLLNALLLIFFVGTEQACLLECSCQLDGVIDCRDLSLTVLQVEAEVVDWTIGTVSTAFGLPES